MKRASDLLAIAVIGAALSALLGACSLTRSEPSDCETNAQCRARFGFGSICGGEGLCVGAPPSPRCTEAHPADLLTRPERHRGAVVFGSLMDRSLVTHRARENAIRLAAEQVAEQGGLEGKTLGVVFCNIEEDLAVDASTRTEAAVSSALYLAHSIGVPAIIGPSASTDAQAVYGALNGSDTLIISPAATSNALTGIDVRTASDDNPGLLWRTVPPDSIQAAAIAEHMLGQDPAANVAVIHETGAYGEGMTATFVPELERSGATATVFSFDSNSARDAAVTQVGALGVGWVLFVSSQTTDIIAFLNAAAGLSAYNSKQIFLTDAAANADLLEGTNPALFDQIRGSRPKIPSGSIYEQFAASYRAAHNVDPAEFSFVPHAYDAAWLAFYGSAWSRLQEGRIHGAGIARGLRRVSSGPLIELVPSAWPTVVQSFREGSGIDVLGASGGLDFDPSSEEIRADIEIWVPRLDRSGFDVIDTVSL